MNPVIAALASGIAAGLSRPTSRAVADAYIALIAHLQARFPDVELGPLRAAPYSKLRQQVLADDLARAGAGRDPKLSQLAWALVVTVARHVPQAASDVGIDLEELKRQFLNFQLVGVRAAGPAGQLSEP